MFHSSEFNDYDDSNEYSNDVQITDTQENLQFSFVPGPADAIEISLAREYGDNLESFSEQQLQSGNNIGVQLPVQSYDRPSQVSTAAVSNIGQSQAIPTISKIPSGM